VSEVFHMKEHLLSDVLAPIIPTLFEVPDLFFLTSLSHQDIAVHAALVNGGAVAAAATVATPNCRWLYL